MATMHLCVCVCVGGGTTHTIHTHLTQYTHIRVYTPQIRTILRTQNNLFSEKIHTHTDTINIALLLVFANLSHLHNNAFSVS